MYLLLGSTSGTRQSIGSMDFYHFSNGAKGTRQSISGIGITARDQHESIDRRNDLP